jgi:hypothetical protein
MFESGMQLSITRASGIPGLIAICPIAQRPESFLTTTRLMPNRLARSRSAGNSGPYYFIERIKALI